MIDFKKIAQDLAKEIKAQSLLKIKGDYKKESVIIYWNNNDLTKKIANLLPNRWWLPMWLKVTVINYMRDYIIEFAYRSLREGLK